MNYKEFTKKSYGLEAKEVPPKPKTYSDIKEDVKIYDPTGRKHLLRQIQTGIAAPDASQQLLVAQPPGPVQIQHDKNLVPVEAFLLERALLRLEEGLALVPRFDR